MPNPDFHPTHQPALLVIPPPPPVCSRRPEALVPWEQQQKVGHTCPCWAAAPHLMPVLLQVWRNFLQTMFRSIFYSPCLAAFRSPIHLCCVIYQETTIQPKLNELFQPSSAVSNKVSGIFSHSWQYQILDPAEITYNTSLLFLWPSSGPSRLIRKLQSEFHVLSLGPLPMWEGLRCVLLAWELWPHRSGSSWTEGGNACSAHLSSSFSWQCLQLLLRRARGIAE